MGVWFVENECLLKKDGGERERTGRRRNGRGERGEVKDGERWTSLGIKRPAKGFLVASLCNPDPHSTTQTNIRSNNATCLPFTRSRQGSPSVPCCVPWQLLSRRCSNQVCILLLQTRLALVLCQHRPLALSEKGKPNQPQAWRLFNEKVTRGPLTPDGRPEAASGQFPRPWIPSARTPASAPRHIPTAVAFHQRRFYL